MSMPNILKVGLHKKYGQEVFVAFRVTKDIELKHCNEEYVCKAALIEMLENMKFPIGFAAARRLGKTMQVMAMSSHNAAIDDAIEKIKEME